MKIKTPATVPATVPVKKVKAPVAAVPAKAAPKAAKVVKEEGATSDASSPKPPSKHVGRTSGMRVMQYQDHTMAQQPKNKFTDEELAANWQAEFPDTRCRFEQRPEIIRVVRRLFNERRHGKQEIFSDTLIPKYEVQNGKRVPVTEEKPKRGPKASATEAA